MPRLVCGYRFNLPPVANSRLTITVASVFHSALAPAFIVVAGVATRAPEFQAPFHRVYLVSLGEGPGAPFH
jgi:hypothetical protein